jgi:hypothetical protein
VAINERLYRFDAAILKGAPANAGVYTLWQDGEMIYLGHSGSIKTSLLEHLEGRAERESELLAEFRQRHGRPPRCNGKAA